MTNREKHINNASDEELSLLLGYGAILKDNKLSTPLEIDIERRYNYDEKVKLAQNSKDIQDWLSQEAEEDIVYIPNIGKIPKTDKITFDYERPEIIQLTKGAYKDILRRLGELEDSKNDIRPLIETDENIGMLIKEIVALQERVKELEKCSKCSCKNNYGTLETKTADEMFEKLEYVKMIDDSIYVGYEHFVDRHSCGRVTIYKTDYSYAVRLDNDYFRISPGLDKAIHKKIAEIRLSKENHIVGDIVDGKVLCGDGTWQEYR